MRKTFIAITFLRRPVALYIFTAVLSVLLFSWLQISGNFPDPDSFYHGRMAALVAERGPVHDFPWLPYTIFADRYVDHHFLYHVLLAPFVVFGTTMAEGLRLSAIAFATVVVLGGALLLRALGAARIAFLAPLLFLASGPLVFRLNLAKTPALSLLALFVGFYAAAKRKPLLLAFTSFLYVWLYNGWFLLVLAALLLILADAFLPERAETERAGSNWRHRLFGERNRELLLAVASGVLLGHVINPYFPENLSFAWFHIVKIGLLGFRDELSVGAEWYPYTPYELLAATPTTFLALLFGVVAFFFAVMHARERGLSIERSGARGTIALYLFSFAALIFTLRSKRNIEYFVPFAVLAAVSSFDLFFKARAWEGLRFFSQKTYARYVAGALAIFFVVSIGWIVLRDLRAVRKDFDGGIPSRTYQAHAAWLVENTSEGALVFHTDWDDFPYFFSHQTHNRWIAGLDPAFFYANDPERFALWIQISRGEIREDLVERLRDDFDAAYAFVDASHPEAKAAFDATIMQKVFEDGEGTIYRVPSRQ